ncbi:hypothetical protein AXX17_AT5G67160 [Arabidopsis thaliana]|uniref:RING-type E3 ubiquitin transferase n=1 Tax=Arabidopsis thaliana TaxID=3702 RepID=A0A178UKK8_ARATH|nr:hypothetical protein AXX17_AT5G67160 [Arabidopsis thaliana]
MDPNEDNSEIPDSPFSFMWLLFGDDWDLWDTYSPVDADDISPDPTLDVNGDGPAIEPGSLLKTISWEITFEQDSLQSWNDEQSETTSVVECTDVSSHGNTFTNEEETLEQYWRNWLQSSTNEQFETESLEEYTNPSSHGDIFTYEELLSMTEETGDERTGLSEEVIDENLIRRKYEKRSDDETKRCVICQQKLKDNEEVSKLGCGHDFHFGCIKNWLMVTNKCPLCNREVV